VDDEAGMIDGCLAQEGWAIDVDILLERYVRG